MAKKEKVKPNWLDPSTTAENEVLPKYFKWAWTARGTSLAVNVLFIMQLTYYCTDMLGMATSVVGMLLLASKIFDGVTDILVGFLIDRTHTKLGKARPYEIAILFVWGLTILLYSAPNLSQTGLCVFVFILYTLINSVCATFLNGGDAVYLARSVRSEKNRVSVMSFNGSVLMLFTIVLGIIMPQLIAGIGSTRAGWSTMALMFGIPFGIIGFFRFLFVQEVVSVSTDDGKTPKEGAVPLKEALICIFKNKYLWMIAIMSFIAQLTSNMGTAVGTYYFKYIIGDISLATVVSLGSMVTPFAMMAFPALSRKFGTVQMIRFGAVLGVIGYAIRTIGGANLATLAISAVLGSVAILPINTMIVIYLIDCMDYGEWRTGTRVEGMITSVNSFMCKLGSGIASGSVGLIMGIAGYDGTLEVQSAMANNAIIALNNWIPLILMIVMLFFAIIYKIDKEMPQIKADLAARHK